MALKRRERIDACRIISAWGSVALASADGGAYSMRNDAFQSVVTGDILERGKPHPEPYLTAASELGVAAGDCLAIEDSTTGATSAEAAGCTVLVVENHVRVAPGPRRVFRDTLVGITVADLRVLFA